MNNNTITITQEKDTTIGALKDLLSSLPDNASVRIDNDAKIHVGNITNQDIENFANAQYDELNNKPLMGELESALFNNLKSVYDTTEVTGLDYDPVIYDNHNNVILDNTDAELTIANTSPALHIIARKIRDNNKSISDIMARHAKKATEDMLEYMTQCIINAADASTFDGEMRMMCKIVDKDK